jgi:type IV secretory pathway TraG/TraD family ATPase VirD4
MSPFNDTHTALSILSNCTSQLFFPPREPHTAELISRAFGSRLEVTQQATFDSISYGSRYPKASRTGPRFRRDAVSIAPQMTQASR